MVRKRSQSPTASGHSRATPLDDPVSIVALILAAYPLIKDGIDALRKRRFEGMSTQAERELASQLYTDLLRLDSNARTLHQFLSRKKLSLESSIVPGAFVASLTAYEHSRYARLFDDCLNSLRSAFDHATAIAGGLESRHKPPPQTELMISAIREFNKLRIAETYTEFFSGVETVSALLRKSLSELGFGGEPRRRPKPHPPPSPGEGDAERARTQLMKEVDEAQAENKRVLLDAYWNAQTGDSSR